MNTSDTIKELVPALLAFQAEVEAVPKGADNPFFKSKYADLPSIVKAAQPLLSKNGLGVIQTVGGTYNDTDTLTTRLVHTSGEWIEDEARIHLGEKDTAQAQGSAITYARRYHYSAILGLVTDVDDDGNAASLNDDTPSEEGQKVRRTRRSKEQVAADKAGAAAVFPTSDGSEPPVVPVQGETPADPVVVPETETAPAPPDGWDTTANAVAAHNLLAKRIVALPADFREPAMAYRKEHGWPLPLAEFNEVEEVVGTAEGFSA